MDDSDLRVRLAAFSFLDEQRWRGADLLARRRIVVTDRGRRVAALQPFDASVTGRPLPNREAAIRKRSKVLVDSAVYQAELREDR